MSFREKTTRFASEPRDSITTVTGLQIPIQRPTPAQQVIRRQVVQRRQRRVAKAQIIAEKKRREREVPTTPTPTPTPPRDDIQRVFMGGREPTKRPSPAELRKIPKPPPERVPTERVEVLPSRIIETPTGERREVFPQPPRIFEPPTPARGEVLLFTPETFKEDVTRETLPSGDIKVTTRTTPPFTLLTFQEKEVPAEPTPEQLEIQRRREILGTVTEPRDIGAFAGVAGLVFTRPEARALAAEEFGLGFASPFTEIGESVSDLATGQFEPRAREQPTFLSDLISVGGAQLGGLLGVEEPAPSATFEALLERQAAKTPQRITGEVLGEAALTIGTLGIGKGIQVGIKAAQPTIKTVTNIVKGLSKQGLPKFNQAAIKGSTKTKSASDLTKQVTTYNKKLDKIDNKFGKLDQKEVNINKSRFLSQNAKNKKLAEIRNQRRALDKQTKELRREGNQLRILVKESAIAKPPAERITGVGVRTPRTPTPEELGIARIAPTARFTGTLVKLGRGRRVGERFGEGFFGAKPRPPKPPTETTFRSGGETFTRRDGQLFKHVTKAKGLVELQPVIGKEVVKQTAQQVTKQQKELAKQAKKLKKAQQQLTQATKKIKKKRKAGEIVGVTFEELKFPKGVVRPIFARPTPALTTRVGTRQLFDERLVFGVIPTFRQIGFEETVQQRFELGVIPIVPTRAITIFEEPRLIPKPPREIVTPIITPTGKVTVREEDGLITTPVTTTKLTEEIIPKVPQRLRFAFPPFFFDEEERKRRREARRRRRSELGLRLFDIAEEPFGEVEVGLGFFVEQKRPEQTIAEAIGLEEVPLTAQERRARARLGRGRGRRDFLGEFFG